MVKLEVKRLKFGENDYKLGENDENFVEIMKLIQKLI